MSYAGIDIGSRTVKLIIVENDKISISRKAETSFDPLAVAKKLLSGVSYDKIIATGYGRHLFSQNYNCEVVSEIKAFGIGVHSLYPECSTILDIGGQDIKAIKLLPNGKIGKFEMNDKCSAGTGRFLEIMSMALGSNLNEFGDLALSAENSVHINSMCTVFAESEVISLLSRGAKREEVALGVHNAVVIRSLSMLRRVLDESGELIFVGGVALNNAIVGLLAEKLQRQVIIPEIPQMCGALGCALHASRESKEQPRQRNLSA